MTPMYHNLPIIEKYFTAKLDDILREEKLSGIPRLLLTLSVLKQVSDLIKDTSLYTPLLRKQFVAYKGIPQLPPVAYDLENIHNNLLVGNNINKPFGLNKLYKLVHRTTRHTVSEGDDGNEYQQLAPIEVTMVAQTVLKTLFQSLLEPENTVAYLFALARFNSCIPSDLEEMVPSLAN